MDRQEDDALGIKSWLGDVLMATGRALTASPKSAQGSSRSLQGMPISGDIPFLSGGAETASGIAITPSNVLTSSAVFACIRVIAETVASVPLKLYRNIDIAGKSHRIQAKDHALYSLLHDAANPEQTAHEFWEWMQGAALVYGTSFAEIERGKYGEVEALWPLLSERMRVSRDKYKRLQYFVQLDDGQETVLRDDQVFKLKSFSTSGVLGLALTKAGGEAIGTAMAQQKWVSKFYSNNARPAGVLEHPSVINDEDQINNLRASWENVYKGLDNAHRVAILEEGMKYHEIGVSPEAAQLIEARTFQVQEVARLFRMQPHMIQELSHATFTNIEHQGIEFVVHTMNPYFTRIQQRIWMQLLNPAEQRYLYAKFLLLALLRGDSHARGEYYWKLFQMGAISPDDIRELEEMNPLPDGRGDVYLVPRNLVAISGYVPEGPESSVVPRAFEAMLADVVRRLERAEEREIKKARQKFLSVQDAIGFEEWQESFIESHREFVKTQVEPVYQAFERPGVEDWVDAYMRERFNGRHHEAAISN